ncbi:MEKHLA domain-containing protein [Denitratisoma oestradiolicum]|uniref:Uncharacterized protein n=1 Tax=Denitratisoma oestradiolicum TaxID=311182 RepID=A0A6S6Y5K7_9PROT|nr:MEKHLA domain-containing protein [Denitratisoma oestradiolicum]TWO81150.1 MEKHLA domain-containing protein [Denitratisoma oestradiolicum]CAB1367838.1 conserved protein of unknown function [Denitratisoma oestradiolicum]
MTPPPEPTAELRRRVERVAASFRRLLGRPLLPGAGADTWSALWHAPAVIVAHGTEGDPVFFYGNRLALELFEMDFAAFTRLPSRCSAEPMARAERERLLQRVSRDGYIDDYAGVRISASGRRFRIEQAVVWNLLDADGTQHGQAATFGRWMPLG